MNNKQRVQIEVIKDKLQDLKDEVESIREDEESKYENLPEGLQVSEKGEKLEAIAGYLSDAVDGIDTSITELDNAISE